jgi:hypothetical protein
LLPDATDVSTIEFRQLEHSPDSKPAQTKADEGRENAKYMLDIRSLERSEASSIWKEKKDAISKWRRSRPSNGASVTATHREFRGADGAP